MLRLTNEQTAQLKTWIAGKSNVQVDVSGPFDTQDGGTELILVFSEIDLETDLALPNPLALPIPQNLGPHDPQI